MNATKAKVPFVNEMNSSYFASLTTRTDYCIEN